MVFLLPIVGFLVYSGAALINRGIAPEGVNEFFGGSTATTPQGIVDYSGLIKSIPDEMKSNIVLLETEQEARQMTGSGAISAYFIIPKNYTQTGKIDFVQKNYNFLATEAQTESIKAIITRNLFSEDKIAQRYLLPMNVELVYLREQTAKDFGGSQNFWLPYSMMMLFYMLIIGASSLMLTSIVHEKQNCVMEILLTSLSPTELLVGKTISLGIAGLFQTLVWLGTGFTLVNLAGRQFSLPESFILAPSILIWGLVFFMLGYALYSSLMAGLGALVPNPKEGSQATIVVIFPLIIPLFFSNLVATSPNAPLFVFFSLFPLTSPISMVSRMSAAAIPAWQLAVSVSFLILSILAANQGVIRLFRAQALLSGKPFNVKEFINAFFSHPLR
jgi:ABC-2 type transport system permease protein